MNRRGLLGEEERNIRREEYRSDGIEEESIV
jgi:hypothetical protein